MDIIEIIAKYVDLPILITIFILGYVYFWVIKQKYSEIEKFRFPISREIGETILVLIIGVIVFALVKSLTLFPHQNPFGQWEVLMLFIVFWIELLALRYMEKELDKIRINHPYVIQLILKIVSKTIAVIIGTFVGLISLAIIIFLFQVLSL